MMLSSSIYQDSSSILQDSSSSSCLTCDTTTLPISMQKALPKLYNETLQPVDISFGLVRTKDKTISIRDTARKMAPQHKKRQSSSTVASVVQVFRKPGCMLCREQGLDISALVANMKDVNIWGVICETGIYDEELLELRDQYFRHPFYKDEKKSIYKALGDEEISFPGRSLFEKIKKRLKAKNVTETEPGAGQNKKLGGVVIFDSKGFVRYASQEDPWEGTNLKAIQDVIECIRLEHKEEDRLSSSASSFQ